MAAGKDRLRSGPVCELRGDASVRSASRPQVLREVFSGMAAGEGFALASEPRMASRPVPYHFPGPTAGPPGSDNAGRSRTIAHEPAVGDASLAQRWDVRGLSHNI